MDFAALHTSIQNLYDDMMPMCSSLLAVARAIAGLGALAYISRRVWAALGAGREIDVVPLLRPFAIGILIAFFPTLVLGTLNAVCGALSSATSQMAVRSAAGADAERERLDEAERTYLKEKVGKGYIVDEEEFQKEMDKLGFWEIDDMVGMYIDRAIFSTRLSIRSTIMEVMQFLFRTAELVLDALRTFFLTVLSILGPLAFAFAVWDPLRGSMREWMARYVTVSLWMPVANILSALLGHIETLMLQADLDSLAGATQTGPGLGRAVFFAIGIIGYASVPTVAGWIVSSAGVAGYTSTIHGASRLMARSLTR